MIVTVTLNPAIDQTVQVEKLSVGSVNRALGIIEIAGGKGINVARVLADLGHEVRATGFMGVKSHPFFHAYFKQHRIQDRFVSVYGKVRTNIKLVDRSDSTVTDINLPGFSVVDSQLTSVFDPIQQLPESTWVAVCGSLPEGISLDAFERFLARIKSAGMKLAIDTSGPALTQALAVKPDLIKPNIHELEALAGKALSPREAVSYARGLIKRGIGTVVLSSGAGGAWFLSGQQTLLAVPGRVDVVSTVGAGDSMVAACLSSLDQHFSLDSMARLATACSMKAVSKTGVGLDGDSLWEVLSDRVTIYTL
ncbi:Tagatose-6-phosphate kinase [invertebrate metagenome]|uniref:1-phosphofructokinase n=1 Tax=invertebrate metagenome TaxID=1711999 RepID=A0A2H9TCD7_9ZZZZ